MLYGPYIKSLRSWDGSGGLSSTSTATIYTCQGPSNSKIWGYTHINVAMVNAIKRSVYTHIKGVYSHEAMVRMG